MADRESQPRSTSIGAFVGRERELAELRAGLDDSVAGRGRLFPVSGEPGIGKTRLAEEIAKDAAARGVRVVWGRCWEGARAPAYWPLIQVIRTLVEGVGPSDLIANLGSHAPEIARVVPELFPPAAMESSAAGLDPEQARFRLFDAVMTLAKSSARLRAAFPLADRDRLEAIRGRDVAADDELAGAIRPHLEPVVRSLTGLIDAAATLGDDALQTLLTDHGH